MDIEALAGKLVEIARAAGAVIQSVYDTEFEVRGKDDASPVTEADELAEALIEAELARLTPKIPVVAEEAMAGGHVPAMSQQFWLVDPLDGTREFVSRNGEFTVNIGLIDGGKPVLGVVYAPVLGRMFVGGAGMGAWEIAADGERRELAVRAVPAAGLTVVASRRHGDSARIDEYLSARAVAGTVLVGSSLKMCMIAAAQADLYLRFGRTMEWDTAAAHAVLNAAGGAITTLDGVELAYGKPAFENPDFIASNGAVLKGDGGIKN
jgi:3'(2'), 5'-bisphosphate nucleotidase